MPSHVKPSATKDYSLRLSNKSRAIKKPKDTYQRSISRTLHVLHSDEMQLSRLTIAFFDNFLNSLLHRIAKEASLFTLANDRLTMQTDDVNRATRKILSGGKNKRETSIASHATEFACDILGQYYKHNKMNEFKNPDKKCQSMQTSDHKIEEIIKTDTQKSDPKLNSNRKSDETNAAAVVQPTEEKTVQPNVESSAVDALVNTFAEAMPRLAEASKDIRETPPAQPKPMHAIAAHSN